MSSSLAKKRNLRRKKAKASSEDENDYTLRILIKDDLNY